MALVQAYLGIDSLSVDLNFYSRYFYDDEFYNNINFQYDGRTYEDAYLIDGYDGSADLVLAFFGYGIGFDSSGRVNRGTVTALAEGTYSGYDIWDIQGISISASRLNSVASTYSNADDRALIGSVLNGNDTIRLSAYDDRFEGWGGNDQMFGGGGNDTLLGGDGNDTIQGGVGNDIVNGGAGRDHMTAGQGNDIYIVTAGDLTVEQANGGIDQVNSAISWNLSTHVENLTLTGSANSSGNGNSLANSINGNAGHNVLNGGAGSDRILGASGNDTLNGGDGNDMVNGGIGNDLLIGNIGNDRIIGSIGADRMAGNAGADSFVFTALSDSTVSAAGRDTISDFSRAQHDRIDLGALDANARVAGNQAFNYLGDAAFTGQAGELSARNVTGGTLISGDVNGDRIADFALLLDDRMSLGADSFIL